MQNYIHFIHNGWLRAAIFGTNDGILYYNCSGYINPTKHYYIFKFCD